MIRSLGLWVGLGPWDLCTNTVANSVYGGRVGGLGMVGRGPKFFKSGQIGQN